MKALPGGVEVDFICFENNLQEVEIMASFLAVHAIIPNMTFSKDPAV